MGRSMETNAATATYHWSDRPPILEATRALGINDRRVAKLVGIFPEQVHSWVSGKRPIPHIHILALIFMVGRLTGAISPSRPVKSRYSRRAELALDCANRWLELAKLELAEDSGFHDLTQHPDVMRAYDVGEAALAKLERADAA
jgi:hypothetical protein